MKVFCIRDLVAGYSMSPVISENDVTFQRMVRGEVMNAGATSNIRNFPGDYSLECIGEWDPESGVLTGYPQARSLGKVSDFAALPPVDNTESGVPPTPPI